MLFEQNIKNKHLKVLIMLCLISLSNQTFAGHLMTKKNHYHKPLKIVYEQGQFFIVPAEKITTININQDVPHPLGAVKTDTRNPVKVPDASNTQKSHIYLFINTSNKEKSS